MMVHGGHDSPGEHGALLFGSAALFIATLIYCYPISARDSNLPKSHYFKLVPAEI